MKSWVTTTYEAAEDGTITLLHWLDGVLIGTTRWRLNPR